MQRQYHLPEHESSSPCTVNSSGHLHKIVVGASKSDLSYFGVAMCARIDCSPRKKTLAHALGTNSHDTPWVGSDYLTAMHAAVVGNAGVAECRLLETPIEPVKNKAALCQPSSPRRHKMASHCSANRENEFEDSFRAWCRGLL